TSIGPRPIDRGNEALVGHYVRRMGLQWGRDQTTAEMRPHHHRDLADILASIGPRSIDRGNLSRLPPGSRAGSRFNRAAIEGRGNRYTHETKGMRLQLQ